MNRVFADTSFYVGLLHPGDALHRRCLRFDLAYRGCYVTSEFVLIELDNRLAGTHRRELFVKIDQLLRSNPRTTILPATTDWFAQGMMLYADRPDKQWSFTDCISFQMMRQQGVTDALTADHHFTQAGYRAILAEAGN